MVYIIAAFRKAGYESLLFISNENWYQRLFYQAKNDLITCFYQINFSKPALSTAAFLFNRLYIKFLSIIAFCSRNNIYHDANFSILFSNSIHITPDWPPV